MEKVAKWLILQREQATMLEKLCIMQSETNTVSEISSMIVLCRSTKCCTSAPVAHWVEPVTHMLKDKQLPGFDYAPGNFLCAISPLSLLTFLKMLQNAHKKALCVVCKRFSQQDQKNTMICKKLRQHKNHSKIPNV